MPEPEAHALDYRQHYGGPNQPAPQGGHYPNPYWTRLTTGQWVMIGAAALAVGGLAYWGYTAYREHQKKQAAQQNPVRHIHVGNQPQPFQQAA